jgi:hypothetical protein
LKGPKTASYIADHQNLSIKDASWKSQVMTLNVNCSTLT